MHRVQRCLGQAAQPKRRVAAGAAAGRVQGGGGSAAPAVQAKRGGLPAAKRAKQPAPGRCAARRERLGLERGLPHRLLRCWLRRRRLLLAGLPLLLRRAAAAAAICQHGLLLLCQAGGQPIQVPLVLHHQQLHSSSGQPIPRLQLLQQHRRSGHSAQQAEGQVSHSGRPARQSREAAPAPRAYAQQGRWVQVHPWPSVPSLPMTPRHSSLACMSASSSVRSTSAGADEAASPSPCIESCTPVACRQRAGRKVASR